MSANLCFRIQSRMRRLADTSLSTISCQVTGREYNLDSCSHTVLVNWVITAMGPEAQRLFSNTNFESRSQMARIETELAKKALQTQQTYSRQATPDCAQDG